MTDNRTNEPTDEQVEAAAEGMWDRYGDRGMFQHAAEHLRSAFRKDARAALVAAAGAASVQPSSTVDEDALARLLCEKNYLSPDGKPTCAECRDKAHEVAEWLKEQSR